MLKIISHAINRHSSHFHSSTLPHLLNQHSPLFPCRRIAFGFNKKHEPQKKKKSEAPKVPAKTVTDYMTGPEHMKKNVLEVKNMQTSSQAILQDDSLRAIIVEQRTLLQKSLHEELNPEKTEENLSLRKRILNKYLKPQELNKYYIKRPLKFLENIYFSLFLVNAASLTWLEYTNAYNSIGWFFGYFTAPAATSVLALLIGYNFAFWVVRHSFNLHLPLAKIHQTRISHITTSWRNVAELTFIASQFLALAYCLSFGCPISMYKFQLLMVTMNFANLALNIYQILKYTKIPIRSYLQDYMRIISLSTLLILIFALYQIQITAGNRPEDAFDSQAYRSRVVELNNGYKEYINFFKKKKYVMKENEKINSVDVD